MPPLPVPADTLLAIADAVGTPTYVYSEAIVERQIGRLRDLVDGLPVDLLYAMKANASPALLALVRDAGLGVDAVSPGELALALRLGFARDRVLFSANMMSDDEMEAAHAAGVLLNVGELSRLDAYGAAHPGADVCVRLNPGVGAGHHAHVVTAGDRTKFGIALDRIGDVLDVAARRGLRIVGLHQHIGSGILDPALFAPSLDALLGAADRFPDLAFVNVGGGLGVPYHPDEAEIDADAFRAVVGARLSAFAARRPGVRLRLEPGRFLVAQAGVLLARVTVVKAGARHFTGTDSGMNHLARPTVYGAYHGVANVTRPDAAPVTTTVTGNICETGDVFAEARDVPEPHVGDVLALLDAGAYGMAMASTYNLRPLPAEVLVRASGTWETVRRRITPEALVDAWMAG